MRTRAVTCENVSASIISPERSGLELEYQFSLHGNVGDQLRQGGHQVTFRHGTPVVPPAGDGPVPVMLATELTLARSGAIDTDLLAIPFIPGLRDIPRWIPVHRLIWRDRNRQPAGPTGQPEPGPKPEPAGQK